jgi:hypothetical protein
MATSKGENAKINYDMDTRGEKKKRTSKKAAMTAGNLEQDQ